MANASGPGKKTAGPPRVWFHRGLKYDPKNRGKSVAERKRKAQSDCVDILKKLRDDWVIADDGFEWTDPADPSSEKEKFRLKVWIVQIPGGPSNPPIPAPKQPPPAM